MALTPGPSASAGREPTDTPVAGPPDSYDCFLRYSHILSSLLRELLEERFLAELRPHRLTRAQFCCLKLIALNADLRVGELARCLGVTSAASSKSIDKLERLGLVERSSSSEDRRVALITASAEGRRVVERYEAMKAERIGPVVAALGERRVGELCTSLKEVCVGLLDDEAAGRGPCLRCAGYYRADCSVASARGRCALRAPEGAVRGRHRHVQTRSWP